MQVEHGHLCHVKATCYNTIGSFHCKCWPGYHGDGKFCVPEKNIMAGALYRSKSHDDNAISLFSSENTAYADVLHMRSQPILHANSTKRVPDGNCY